MSKPIFQPGHLEQKPRDNTCFNLLCVKQCVIRWSQLKWLRLRPLEGFYICDDKLCKAGIS